MLDIAYQAVAGFWSLSALAFLTLGMIIGLVFGVIPGLGGATALALLMPLTYGMDPTVAITLAGGVMGSVSMGGSITAVLLNTPGTAPNAPTCLDGYPMAQQGKAGLAIGAAASASSLGGLIGVFTLLLVLPVAKQLVLSFGPPEFFLLAVLGIVTVAASSFGHTLRGLVTGALGLMLSFVGFDAVNGGSRFDFGAPFLWEGIPLVPALIGLFAISEMIALSVKGGSVAHDPETAQVSGLLEGAWSVIKHWPVLVKGSAIGTIFGAIPGVGGTVAAFLAYSATAHADRHPETFGTGRIEGVIAPEAANNAKDGGNLIPTLAFGIPGSVEMAVFIGFLILHGLDPGPMMLIEHPQEIYSLVLALTLSCVLASVLGLWWVKPLARITTIDVHILVPLVVAVSAVGAYSVRQDPFDIAVAMAFGIIGYLLQRADYPRLTFVIALVLGETAERSFHQTMMISDGSLGIFVSHSVSLVLMILILLSLAIPALRTLRRAPVKVETAS